MNALRLHAGLKTDPIETRYSYEWLFRLMAEEGIRFAQLGSFTELYVLPDAFFEYLRRQADRFGIEIASLFTTHRELGGFMRPEPGWPEATMQLYRRMIDAGAVLGAPAVGGNPGSILRDRMSMKPAGVRSYMAAMKKLMRYAHDRGVPWLIVEPMSCLAEPPTLPDEIREMGEELAGFHAAHSGTTARAGYCVDVAHGYIDGEDRLVWDNVELFRSTVPWLHSVHLKNTDRLYDSTFGFTEADLARGIIDVAATRDLLLACAARLPVSEVIGYLEIGGPKIGRDYSDGKLEPALRESLRHVRKHFTAELPVEPSAQPKVERSR
jgi:ribulose-phosphate 3-epimerase